jgi:hypothetical protein
MASTLKLTSVSDFDRHLSELVAARQLRLPALAVAAVKTRLGWARAPPPLSEIQELAGSAIQELACCGAAKVPLRDAGTANS